MRKLEKVLHEEAADVLIDNLRNLVGIANQATGAIQLLRRERGKVDVEKEAQTWHDKLDTIVNKLKNII